MRKPYVLVLTAKDDERVMDTLCLRPLTLQEMSDMYDCTDFTNETSFLIVNQTRIMKAIQFYLTRVIPFQTDIDMSTQFCHMLIMFQFLEKNRNYYLELEA